MRSVFERKSIAAASGSKRCCCLVVAAALALSAQRVEAFSVESAYTVGCHEQLTIAALGRAGWPEQRTEPQLSETERRIFDDLPFSLSADGIGPWAMALLVGCRDNDLRGVPVSDLAGLAAVHAHPETQAAHCLRAPSHDGPEGDVAAIAACRQFILTEVDRAFGADDALGFDLREQVRVALVFRGPTEVPLSRAAFHVGRALHALQDSYSHTLRADARRIRHVLNYVDSTGEDYDVVRDGLQHLAFLDDCDAGERADWAVDASAELLAALSSADGPFARDSRKALLDRVRAVLDQRLQHKPGCDHGNRYCDAPELDRIAAGCSLSGAPAAPTLLSILALAVLGLLRARRASLALCLGALLLCGTARAARPPAEQPSAAPGRWGVIFGGGAALDRGAFVLTAGGRLRLGDRWSVGADVEYNPWYSLDVVRVAPGSLNIYGTVVFRWVTAGRFAFHSAGHVGASVLLFDLYGADQGSVGPHLGLSLLGVSIGLGQRFRLVIDPADVAMPIPQTAGVPLYYRQYRITVRLQFNP